MTHLGIPILSSFKFYIINNIGICTLISWLGLLWRKWHKLGDLNSRDFILTVPEARNLRSRCQQDWYHDSSMPLSSFSWLARSLGMHHPYLCFHFHVTFSHAWVCVHISPFDSDTGYIGSGVHPTPLKLLGLGLQHTNFGGHSRTHNSTSHCFLCTLETGTSFPSKSGNVPPLMIPSAVRNSTLHCHLPVAALFQVL